MPDFDRARAYALRRLETELAQDLTFHAARHTRDDVVPAAERLARMAGVAGEDLLLLLTAAWFHDVGFVVQRDEHEAAGVRISRAELPGFGYSPHQIDIIGNIIMATRLPQSPGTLLEEIMADADLDSLGRADFFEVSVRLREEMENYGTVMDDAVWYRWEINFLEGHRYFTTTARSLRDEGKRHNIEQLYQLAAAAE